METDSSLLKKFRKFSDVSNNPLNIVIYLLESVNDTGKDLKFWSEMIKEADTNGDGVIDYNEFISLMSKR